MQQRTVKLCIIAKLFELSVDKIVCMRYNNLYIVKKGGLSFIRITATSANRIGMEDTYEKKIVYRYSTTMDGNTVRVYEEMRFEVLFSQNKSWSTTVFISTIITAFLGKVVTDTLVQALCTALNVVVSAYSSVAAGAINRYTCSAVFSRYVNVNSSRYPYNMTIRTVSYEAYEDASPSSTKRAKIDSGSRVTSYSKNETYYQNCYAQALDGYNVYKSIGPRS